MSDQPNPIAPKVLAFALLCVAVSTGFIIYMQIRLTNILAAPDWCARAINAEKLAQTRSESTIGACQDLLLKQVSSLALNSHIFAGIIALCLLVLMVIVVAGGQLRLKASKEGVEADVGRQAPIIAAAAAGAAAGASAGATAGAAAKEELPKP